MWRRSEVCCSGHIRGEVFGAGLFRRHSVSSSLISEVFKLLPILLLITVVRGLTKTRDQITSRAHSSRRSTLGCACLPILAHGIRYQTSPIRPLSMSKLHQ